MKLQNLHRAVELSKELHETKHLINLLEDKTSTHSLILRRNLGKADIVVNNQQLFNKVFSEKLQSLYKKVNEIQEEISDL